MLEFRLVIFFAFMNSLCSANQQIVKHVLIPGSESEILLSSDSLNLFCTPTPSFQYWASNCLKDLDISLFTNATDPTGSYDYFEIHDKVTEDSFSADPHLNCASLKDRTSNSPASYFAPLFPSTPMRQDTFASLALTRRIPSLPISCLAICYKSTSGASKTLYIAVKTSYNFQRLFFACFGILLLISASWMSQSIAFYYATGIGSVVLGSLLILLILFARLLPFRRTGTILQSLFVLLGGTFSVVCFALDYVRSFIMRLFISNAELTIAYICFVAFFTFILFYWLQLPEKLIGSYPRTSTIMRNALKFLGVVLLTSSVHLPFTEEQLISLAFTYLPMKDHFVMHGMHRFSPFVCRVWLIISAFFAINLLEFTIKILTKIITPPGLNVGKGFSQQRSSLAPCLPGSPWASSSPYQTPFHTHFPSSKSDLLSAPYPLRANGLHAFRDLLSGDTFSVEHRRSTCKHNEDILTDDESD
ncbi:unnamed protein product [Dicrocoelium dendriticum]|nr:unnamed protein product [Dicrocoelium dendriticum]